MKSTPPALLPRLALSLIIALAAAPAAAQGNTDKGTIGPAMDSLLKDLTVQAGSTVTRDSNLFRRPVAQSETFTSSHVGLRLNKAIAQQQFQFDVTQTATRYETFKRFDFDAINYSGAWNWRLGTRYSGKLSASRAESLAPFEDTVGGGSGRNVRATQNQAFDIDAWVSGNWHLLAGVSQSDQKSEQNSQSRTPDFQSTNASLGIKYLTRAGNALTLRQQTTDGEYVNPLPGTLSNDYTEELSEFSVDWKLSAASTLNVRLGQLKRNNEDPTRRNFSGQSSSLGYAWNSGDKLNLSLTAAQKTSPLQDPTAGHRFDETLSLSPGWRISNKTSTFLRLSYQKSTDRDVLVTTPGGPRRDTTSISAVGLDWSATRTLTLTVSIEHQRRTSNSALASYETTVSRIGAALAF
ncbi:MAG: XrtB/PEP-CTERM-associated polysaccharide biosynthesis outer membrane protein EpsL [Steroidobacteraceae bacterium]